MQKLRLSTTILTSAVLSLALVACGGSDGDGGGGTPSSTEQLVTAAAGGEVALEDGAGVNIPAGALAADTTVTIVSTTPSGLPESATLKGLVYDFGPNGTTFLSAVTLTLPVVGTPADGETAVLSWLNETTMEWTDLPTTLASGKVTAPVDHFTKFIVRFKPDALAGECDFTACGGDLVGSWTLDSACLQDGDTDFFPDCPTAVVELDFSGATGTLELTSGGTFSADFAFSGTLTYTMPASCIPGVTDCTVLAGETGTCAAAAGGDGCTCTMTIVDDDTSVDTGTYTTSGNTVTTDDGDGTPDTQEYCVAGNVLKVAIMNDQGLQIITLTK